MNDLTAYRRVEQRICAADLIVFDGEVVISELIEAFSAGPSHIGIVRTVSHGDVTLAESTVEGSCNGVRSLPLERKLADYPGAAWWLPLADDIRAKIDWMAFYQYIGSADGLVRYDKRGLLEFILRGIPILGPRLFQREHADKLVCSGFVTACLEAAGVLRGFNDSKVSPQDLVEMRLYRECIQILGRPRKLHNFNTH